MGCQRFASRRNQRRLTMEPLDDRHLLAGVDCPDVHGNDADSATPISIPYVTEGAIQFVNDSDFFAIDAIAGTYYDILLESSGLSQFKIYDIDGNTRLYQQNEPHLVWEAPADGTFFFEVVGPLSTSIGGYTLEVESTIVEDDHGDDAVSATKVAVPSVTNGDIQAANDVDFFAFDADGGTKYKIISNHYGLVTVIDTDGVTPLLSHGLVERYWLAPETGTYYIEIVDPGPFDPDYDLVVGVVGFDHGNSFDSATPVEINSSVYAELGMPGSEIDFFSFAAVSGQKYGLSLSLMAFRDWPSDQEVTLYGTDGTTILARARNIDWEAPADGTYFVSTRDHISGPAGKYLFTVYEPTSDCDFIFPAGCDSTDIDHLYATRVASPTPLTDADIGEWLSLASDSSNPLKPTSTTTYVRGDVNLDGNVDEADLGRLLNFFGKEGVLQWRLGNFNGDTTVDSTDLGILLNRFGFQSPPPPPAVKANARLAHSVGLNVSMVDHIYAKSESDDGDDENSRLATFDHDRSVGEKYERLPAKNRHFSTA